MIEDSTKLEILYDHYKDTFQHQIKYMESRNRYFLYSLLLIGILFFQISFPDAAEDLVRSVTQKQIHDEFILDFSIVNSLFLFGLLWVLILYFQTNITIDKQFKYLHMVEEELSNQIAPLEITREGKFYRSNKALISKYIGMIYRIVYPICIMLSIIIKIIFDLKNSESIGIGSLITNILLSAMTILVTFLFLVWSNNKFFKKIGLLKNI